MALRRPFVLGSLFVAALAVAAGQYVYLHATAGQVTALSLKLTGPDGTTVENAGTLQVPAGSDISIDWTARENYNGTDTVLPCENLSTADSSNWGIAIQNWTATSTPFGYSPAKIMYFTGHWQDTYPGSVDGNAGQGTLNPDRSGTYYLTCCPLDSTDTSRITGDTLCWNNENYRIRKAVSVVVYDPKDGPIQGIGSAPAGTFRAFGPHGAVSDSNGNIRIPSGSTVTLEWNAGNSVTQHCVASSTVPEDNWSTDQQFGLASPQGSENSPQSFDVDNTGVYCGPVSSSLFQCSAYPDEKPGVGIQGMPNQTKNVAYQLQCGSIVNGMIANVTSKTVNVTVYTPQCGDGLTDGNEECDDGNRTNGDGCSSSCKKENGYACTGYTPSVCAKLCGNGYVNSGEDCDDGNASNGDGCSASCTAESGYACVGGPSHCAKRCGNGTVDAGENCDDGNASNGDGCSGSCSVESGYSCTPQPLCTSAPGVTEISSATPGGFVESVAVGPDGNIWYAEHQAAKIARMSPGGTQLNEYPVTSGSYPLGITAGTNAVWFAEQQSNKIGRIGMDGTLTEFPLPSGGNPGAMVMGSDGNMWFTEQTGDRVGRITPSGTIKEFSVPWPGSFPNYITVGPDSNIWFQGNNNMIGKMSADGTLLGQYPVPAGASLLWYRRNGIPLPDTDLWLLPADRASILRMDTDGNIDPNSLYLPHPFSGTVGLAAAPDGTVWAADRPGNIIYHFTATAEPIGQFQVPTQNGNPLSVLVQADGTVWFAEAEGSKVGKIASCPYGSVSACVAGTATSSSSSLSSASSSHQATSSSSSVSSSSSKSSASASSSSFAQSSSSSSSSHQATSSSSAARTTSSSSSTRFSSSSSSSSLHAAAVSSANLCGNGVKDSGESCDDNNHNAGDGCSAICQIEAGWICAGTPSMCARIPASASSVAHSSGGAPVSSSASSVSSNIQAPFASSSRISSSVAFLPAAPLSSSFSENQPVLQAPPPPPFAVSSSSSALAWQSAPSSSPVIAFVSSASSSVMIAPPVWQPSCGNGRLEIGEQCDLGTQNSDLPGSSCTSHCLLPASSTLAATTTVSPLTLSPLQGAQQQLAQVTMPAQYVYPVLPQYPPSTPSSGPGSLEAMAAGAAGGIGWMRRKQRKGH